MENAKKKLKLSNKFDNKNISRCNFVVRNLQTHLHKPCVTPGNTDSEIE